MSDIPNQTIFVTIDGIISAGKTTVGAALQAMGYHFIPEPTNQWGDMLQKFYSDPPRYAFTFQMMAFATRSKTYGDMIKKIAGTCKHPIIMERSVYTDHNVFVAMLHDDGVISDTEYSIYHHVWSIAAHVPIKPDLAIYIKTPIDVAMQRIALRGRESEKGITLEYLQRLDRYHDQWLLDTIVDGQPSAIFSKHQDRVPVVLVDGTLAPTDMAMLIDEAIRDRIAFYNSNDDIPF